MLNLISKSTIHLLTNVKHCITRRIILIIIELSFEDHMEISSVATKILLELKIGSGG